MDSYKKWIQRVRVNEYADELIVAAVAAELELRIVCVPYTPQEAATKWKISTYCSTNERGTIFLGNNDVHYRRLGKPLALSANREIVSPRSHARTHARTHARKINAREFARWGRFGPKCAPVV